jgi:uncharacterized membrane protein
MTLMILGLGLWWASHLFPIHLPDQRAAMVARFGAKPYRMTFALVSLVAIVLMVAGFRQADFIEVWSPPAWTVHLNNLLMLLAIFLFGAKDAKSSVKHYVRHPMLAGVKAWTVAHLLVNGDLAAVILFGGLLGWAVVAMIGSNRRDGAWVRPARGDRAGLIRHGVVTVVVFGVIVAIHGPLLGVNPFPH